MPETPLRADETPPRQSAVEDLRNALQVAEAYAELAPQPLTNGERAQREAFLSVARLLTAALAKLSEPSAGAIRAARTMIDGFDALGRADGEHVTEREARDLCTVILAAQLKGE